MNAKLNISLPLIRFNDTTVTIEKGTIVQIVDNFYGEGNKPENIINVWVNFNQVTVSSPAMIGIMKDTYCTGMIIAIKEKYLDACIL